MRKIYILFLITFSLFASDAIVSNDVYKGIKEANELMKKSNFKDAQKILQAIKTSTDTDKIYLYSTFSDLFLSSHQYKKAAKYLEDLLGFEGLDDDKKRSFAINLLQVYMINKEHKKSVALYEKHKTYFKDLKARFLANLAISYADIKSYNKAISLVKKAINSEPKNSTFVEILLSVYSSANRQSELCATMEAANKLGILDGKYTKELAYCLYQKGAPLRGANILESGIKNKAIEDSKKNNSLLFNFLMIAKEYDRAYELAKVIKDSKSSLILIQNLFDAGRYKKCISASNFLESSMASQDKGLAILYMAQSYYYLNDIDNAKKYFSKSLNFSKSKPYAIEWLEYIKG